MDRPQILAAESLPDEPAWRPPLAALRQWLQQTQPRLSDLDIVLSDRLVHYAALPWSKEVTTPAEEQSYARIEFENGYGEAATDWDIRIDGGEYGKPRLACAVERALIEALEAVAKEFNLRMVSLQPHLSALFNARRQQFGG
ncbi:MAG TPA: hypothetical protein PLE35_12540, partial [Lentisphaeria bacterium]|nr:hypothetical protein [Lentisphaeria bacterium]